MLYVYDDGGRSGSGFRGSAGDCVVRSVAIATGQSYSKVYEELAALQGGQSPGRNGKRLPRSARNGVHVKQQWFRDYMLRQGFTWTPTMHIGSGCKVHLADGELPGGRLVVAVSKHYTAVIDGVIHDTFDPSSRGTTIYSLSHPDIPKGAILLKNGNGWAYSPKRCVYGFWTFSQ